MPYVIRWPQKRVLALAAACFALLVVAKPAMADTSCQTLAGGSSVFSQFGDSANYVALPGGTFTGNLSGWTFNEASVVPGGEPWNVSDSTPQQSLSIPSGGSATSPCITLTNSLPSWRFFAQAGPAAPSGPVSRWGQQSSGLQVTVLWSMQDGRSGSVQAASLSPGQYGSWTPTSSLPLGSVLSSGQTVNIQFVFTATGNPWTIDDVFIDPYAR